MDELFGGLFKNPQAHDRFRSQRARLQCAQDGHQYQIHGKATPTKISCKRCGVSWAIGPRTEPVSGHA